MTASIHPTDILTIALLCDGRTQANLTMSGMNGMGDVFKRVRSEVDGCGGVIKVIVRNRTRGWAQQHTLVIKSAPKKPDLQPSAATKSHSFIDYPTLF